MCKIDSGKLVGVGLAHTALGVQRADPCRREGGAPQTFRGTSVFSIDFHSVFVPPPFSTQTLNISL